MLNGINSINHLFYTTAKSSDGSSKNGEDSKTVRVMKQDFAPEDLENIRKQFERMSEESAAASKNHSDDLTKCMKIASRIIAGDNVPYRDDRFLLEKQPLMHSQAWLLRQAKEDPKEYESELDDEDEDANSAGLPNPLKLSGVGGSGNSGGSASSGGSETPSVEMPAIDFTC